MSREELEQKIKGLSDSALRILEKRTGLQLSGLSFAEVNRQLKVWEKAQKASGK